MVGRLEVLLAAIVAGFALIGLSYLVPLPGLELVLFIAGTIIVIIFALAVVLSALRELFSREKKNRH